MSFPVLTPYDRNVATTEYVLSCYHLAAILMLLCPSIFSCVQYAVGSDGIVSVEYSKGGRPIVSHHHYHSYTPFTYCHIQVLIPSVYLHGSGMCGHADSSLIVNTNSAASTISTHSGIIFAVLVGLVFEFAL